MVLDLKYMMLGPGLVREVLDACEDWEGNDAIPKKLQELIMVLRIELSTLQTSSKSSKPIVIESRRLAGFSD